MLYEPIEIIAISYHRPQDFTLCIDSIIQNTHVPYNLTIIDNSCGSINKELNNYQAHNIKIIRNNENIGKGASFKKWYHLIMKNKRSPYIVSLDCDILVPPKWLYKLISAANKTKQFGAIAPVLQKNHKDTFQEQLKNKNLTMHGGYDGFKYKKQIQQGIYYNIKTAGSLFLISKKFFESINGYPGDCIFGHDDGYICSQALKLKKFIGFTTDVSCVHLNNNCTIGYNKWKVKNLNNFEIHKGFWDQSENHDSIGLL